MGYEIKDKDLFQNVFESCIEGILVVDEDGYIIKTNPAIKKMFDYDIKELLHKEVEFIIADEFKEKHRKYRKESFKKSKARSIYKVLDLWGLRKNGIQFPLEISLSPATINDRPIIIYFLIDRTEHLLTQEALATSERRIEESQRIGLVGSWCWNLQTDEKEWSDEFYKIYGLPPKDNRLNARTAALFIHPDDRENALKSVNDAIENKIPYSYEKRIIRPEGTIRNVIAKGRLLYNKNNIPIKMMGTIQDITEQKRVKQELENSEVKNKAILEAFPDMIFVLNHQGKYVDLYAPQSEKLLYPKHELIGKNIKDVLPPKAYEIVKKTLKATIQGEQNQIIEYALNRQNGYEYYEARFVPMGSNNILSIVRDITKKKSIENTLRIRDRALEAVGNGIVIVDAQQPNFPIIYSNNAFSKITGYSKREVLGKNCRFLQNDDREQEQINIISLAINKGQASSEILRNYRKDGTMFWNELTITPVYNNQKKMTHFIGVQNDVTSRKKEELYKDQMRKVLEMIIQRKPLELISKQMLKIVERQINNCIASILILNNEEGIFNELSVSNLPKAISKIVEGASIYPNVGSFGTAAYLKKEAVVTDISKDSSWRDHKKLTQDHGIKSYWSFPVFSSSREVLGVLTIYFTESRKPSKIEKVLISDITQLISVVIEQDNINTSLENSQNQLEEYAQKLEEKVKERTNELTTMVQKLVETNLTLEDQIQVTEQAEKNVITSQSLITTITKNFPNGIIIVVDTDYRTVYIQGEELKKIGLQEAFFQGVRIDQIKEFSKDQKQRLKEDIRRTLTGEHLTFEVEYRNNFYTVNTTPLYNDNKKIERALLVYSNISKQKQVELEILNALKKEQELNELKSRFISLASHEFRTPLSAILSSANLIEKQNTSGKEDKRITYVSKIKSNVKNLVTILNDFLSLSKLEEGKTTIQPANFDLIDFSKSLIKEFETTKKEGQIIKFISDSLYMEVFLDAKLLRHIVLNLLSNATKYSPENKKIILRLIKNKEYISIDIIDQGIGIPIEEQKNLFQRFFRAKNAINIQGTGLGLHIVKQYTELLGGTINFKSKLNKGSSFFVQLPTNQITHEKSTVN